MKGPREVKKADIIIIAVVIAAALIPMISAHFSGGALYARVTVDGQTKWDIDLSGVKDSYYLETEHFRILVEKDAISFVSSDCRDLICVHTGRLTKAGDTAVCVPNRAAIRVYTRGSLPTIITG